jgi:hypothetical protein
VHYKGGVSLGLTLSINWGNMRVAVLNRSFLGTLKRAAPINYCQVGCEEPGFSSTSFPGWAVALITVGCLLLLVGVGALVLYSFQRRVLL